MKLNIGGRLGRPDALAEDWFREMKGEWEKEHEAAGIQQRPAINQCVCVIEESAKYLQNSPRRMSRAQAQQIVNAVEAMVDRMVEEDILDGSLVASLLAMNIAMLIERLWFSEQIKELTAKVAQRLNHR